MSIRTTVTLDEDVMERVKRVSRLRGVPFKEALNDLLRRALESAEQPPQRRTFKIQPFSMGYRTGLNYDDIESLIEYGEGERHR